MYQFSYGEFTTLSYFLSFHWKCVMWLTAEYRRVEVIRVKGSCSVRVNER